MKVCYLTNFNELNPSMAYNFYFLFVISQFTQFKFKTKSGFLYTKTVTATGT